MKNICGLFGFLFLFCLLSQANAETEVSVDVKCSYHGRDYAGTIALDSDELKTGSGSHHLPLNIPLTKKRDFLVALERFQRVSDIVVTIRELGKPQDEWFSLVSLDLISEGTVEEFTINRGPLGLRKSFLRCEFTNKKRFL